MSYISGNYRNWNIFSGWAVKPSQKGSCEKLLDVLLEDVCADNLDAYEWVLDYMADMVQRPEVKNAKILVINGEPGTFKTTVTDVMRKIMGEKYAVTISNNMLTNHFNSQLFGKVLVIADEAIWAGKRDQWGTLKALTGNNTLPITLKGKDTFIADNYIRPVVTTNESYAYPVDEGNRRAVCLTTSSAHQNDYKRKEALLEELENGGYENFMFILMNRKIKTNFHGEVPVFQPEAVKTNRLEALSAENTVAKWVYSSVIGECSDLNSVFYNPNKLVPASELFKQFKAWSLEAGEPKQVTQTTFGIQLSRMLTKERDTKTGRIAYINSDRAGIIHRLEKILGFQIEE